MRHFHKDWVHMFCSLCSEEVDVTPAEYFAANGVLHCEECHFRLEEIEPEMLYEPENLDDRRWERLANLY
jgi:hypothetical protein